MVENARIADRLDAFATLLELADANPYQPRAYRRAAETIRAAPVPIEPLVRTGRVRELRGIGPGIEARLRELVASIASARDGGAAGDPRRWRDSCERLAVVCAAADPAPVLARFETLPQIVAVLGRRGLTVEGVAVDLVVAAPERFGTELV